MTARCLPLALPKLPRRQPVLRLTAQSHAAPVQQSCEDKAGEGVEESDRSRITITSGRSAALSDHGLQLAHTDECAWQAANHHRPSLPHHPTTCGVIETLCCAKRSMPAGPLVQAGKIVASLNPVPGDLSMQPACHRRTGRPAFTHGDAVRDQEDSHGSGRHTIHEGCHAPLRYSSPAGSELSRALRWDGVRRCRFVSDTARVCLCLDVILEGLG